MPELLIEVHKDDTLVETLTTFLTTTGGGVLLMDGTWGHVKREERDGGVIRVWIEAMGQCQWFALCTNEASRFEPHPALGAVPICARCHDKNERLKG